MKTYRILPLFLLAALASGCSESTSITDSGIITCTSDNDCPLGQFCDDGLCASFPDGGNRCRIDQDCPAGQSCQGGRCVGGPDGDGGDGGPDGDGADGGGDGAQLPDIAAEPESLEFGNARIGQEVEQTLRLSNTGAAELRIYSLQLETGTSPELSATPLGNVDLRVAAGEFTSVVIRYRPSDGQADTGALLVASNDPDEALLRVPLSSSYKGSSEIAVVADPATDQPDVQRVDFGRIPVGGSAERELFIKNVGTGNAVLSVTEVRTEPRASVHFALEVHPAPPAFLSPDGDPCATNEECGSLFYCVQGACRDGAGAVRDAVSVKIRYAPQAVGAVEESIVIANDETDGDERPRLIAIAGEGVQPNLTVTPNPVDFGRRYVGETVSLDVTLQNLGGQAVQVSSIHLVTGAAPFTLDTHGQQSFSLPPQASTQVSVRFSPGQAASFADVLEIRSDDPHDPIRVDVRGSAAQPPIISLNPATLDFGEVQLAEESIRSVTVGNAGGSDLTVSRVAVDAQTPADFSVSVSSLGTLAPGQSARLDVRYAPLAPTGSDNGAVEFTSNDPARPVARLTLSGVGTNPEARIAPASIDFGAVPVGSAASPVSVTLSNTGFGTLTVHTLGLGSGSNPDFSLQNISRPLPANLAPGQVLTAQVHFTPQAAGERTAAVAASTSDRDAPSLTVPARGYGGTPEICDGSDNNGNNQVDEGCNDDNDGYCDRNMTCAATPPAICPGGCLDCNDTDPLIHPGRQEVCDGVDNDCDNAIDGADPTLQIAPCELQQGVCAGSLHRPAQCQGGTWDPCEAADYLFHNSAYGPEVCGNALDEDCSGVVNDKDLDGDGYRDVACGGNDCDDGNPNSHPGATEIQDTSDNDCDGLVDEGLIPAGAIIITEVMYDPAAVADTAGEYFEVTNVWSRPVNLRSFRFYDLNSPADSFTVTADIVILPNRAAVLCINGNSSLNGGVACDFDYDNFTLANPPSGDGNPDEIIATLDNFEIDRVVYNYTGWPRISGRAMNLDPAAYSASANDAGASWCSTPNQPAYQLPGGDFGTPGQLNPSCAGALAILDVNPRLGIRQGGETITVTGAGFDATVTVRIGTLACSGVSVIDGSHLTCLTPAQSPGDYDVSVTKGPNTKTLAGAYRYTGEAAVSFGWCNLQHPPSVSVPVNVNTPLIFGRVWKAGVTDPAGPPAGITGQLGYGPAGSDPRTTPGWRWFDAEWNPSCPDCGNNDEFMRVLNLSAAGSYSYAYRFSDDGGFWFTFCDLDGSTNGYQTAQAGSLTVTP